MKRSLCLLLIAACAVALGGCATDPDDKAFFERGWLHPGDHDPR